MDGDEDFLAPSLQNIIDNKELKWIFVGGKGGVGKSSNVSSLAIQLAKVRKNVLLISLDPAHNLSDAFCQKFNSEPQLATGFDNLYVMETDPKKLSNTDFTNQLLNADQTHGFGDILSNIPGIDEALAVFELIKYVDESKYDVMLLDTAPTGHTLNLLRAPRTIETLLSKFDDVRDKFGPLLSTMTGMLGSGGSSGSSNDEEQLSLLDKMDDMKTKVQLIQEKFEDPNFTTFIPVAIPEFLSLFETERLVQELTQIGIDVQNIIINQILFPDDCSNCRKCAARIKMQKKYIDQMELLYIDFHLVKMPLLDTEIRGIDALKTFGEMLISGKPNPRALSTDDDQDNNTVE